MLQGQLLGQERWILEQPQNIRQFEGPGGQPSWVKEFGNLSQTHPHTPAFSQSMSTQLNRPLFICVIRSLFH